MTRMQAATRRAVLKAGWGAGLGWGLAACGGGSGEKTPDGPTVHSLEAGVARVGEAVTMTAIFSGGTGRIEPDVGTVQSGVPVSLPPVTAPRRYTLVVEAQGRPSASRVLDVKPVYRDRYVLLDDATPRQYHAAATTSDGRVLVIGGSRGMAVLSEAVERYEPATRRFTRIGNMYTGRALHTATPLAEGRVLVVGGNVGLSNGGFAELIDERRGSIEPAGWPTLPRIRHASVALADGRVLVVGGAQRDSVELWDPATQRFRLVAARMANVREFPTATRLADGRVLIVGGDHEGATQRLAEIFDPQTESFTPVASPLNEQRRTMHEAHALADGRVLVVGGELRTGTGLEPLDTVLVYDPATQALTLHGRLDVARTLVRGLLLPDGQLRLFGGQTAAEAAARTASAYAPATGGATALAALPAGRAWHTVSALPEGRILIVGGDNEGGGAVHGALLYE
ncbi:Kelch repeat-containing protein [Roseateles sp.]|uniref:Kelch repeat-containing protein n=1 Tax=Roseateles sp. TaxID=1971397 RepID=UPI0039E76837